MKTTTKLKANCVADAAFKLAALPSKFEGLVQFTEQGKTEPWATIDVGKTTDHKRSMFPCFPDGSRGDTERCVAHMGILVSPGIKDNQEEHCRIVVLRASRMANVNC
jgi:hypothetical protein